MGKSSGYVSNKFVSYMFFDLGVYMELDYYETYCNRMEGLLKEQEERLHRKIQEESNGLSGYEKAEHFENYGSSYEYKFVTDIFPDLQRKSGLISLYTILERNLIQICRMQEKMSDNPVKMDDLNIEGYIERARTYLTKVIQINLPQKSETWLRIKMIQELRNKCAHSNGAVPTGNGPLIKYIKKSEFLDIYRPGELFQAENKNHNEPYQVQIKSGYLEGCIAVFREFFEDLFKKLKEKNSPKHELL